MIRALYGKTWKRLKMVAVENKEKVQIRCKRCKARLYDEIEKGGKREIKCWKCGLIQTV
jgi:hypothetical protein